MKTYYSKSKLILAFIAVCCLSATKASAQLAGDFFPLYGQTTEWSIDANNELDFTGSQPMGSPAIIATTFGGLTADATTNDYTDLKLTFDAIVSSDGTKNTTVVLSSNQVWGGKGIIIEINKFQIQGVKNFSYPGFAFISDYTDYQNNVIKPDLYNNFIIDVTASGIITVTVNGTVLPNSWAADVTVLQASSPNPRYAYFCTNFSGFKMKNLTALKGTTTKTYFVSTMPVSLLSFDATKKANGNQLNWETASESNNSHFIVYKSADGSNFVELTRISAKNQAAKYQCLDATPVSGNNYYKLVQVDLNGTTTDLGVKAVSFDLQTENVISIYPKPATGSVNLSFGRTFENAVTVKLVDLTGRTLQQTVFPAQSASSSNYVLNFNSKITSGIYIINVSSGAFTHSERLMVK